MEEFGMEEHRVIDAQPPRSTSVTKSSVESLENSDHHYQPGQPDPVGDSRQQPSGLEPSKPRPPLVKSSEAGFKQPKVEGVSDEWTASQVPDRLSLEQETAGTIPANGPNAIEESATFIKPANKNKFEDNQHAVRSTAAGSPTVLPSEQATIGESYAGPSTNAMSPSKQDVANYYLESVKSWVQENDDEKPQAPLYPTGPGESAAISIVEQQPLASARMVHHGPPPNRKTTALNEDHVELSIGKINVIVEQPTATTVSPPAASTQPKQAPSRRPDFLQWQRRYFSE